MCVWPVDGDGGSGKLTMLYDCRGKLPETNLGISCLAVYSLSSILNSIPSFYFSVIKFPFPYNHHLTDSNYVGIQPSDHKCFNFPPSQRLRNPKLLCGSFPA